MLFTMLSRAFVFAPTRIRAHVHHMIACEQNVRTDENDDDRPDKDQIYTRFENIGSLLMPEQ